MGLKLSGLLANTDAQITLNPAPSQQPPQANDRGRQVAR